MQTEAAISACLIEILITEENSLQKSNPELVVVAPSWKRVEELSEFAKKILEKRKSELKIVNLFRPGSEFEKCLELLEGCQIVFSTAPSLAQMLRTDPLPRLYIDFKSTKWLIFDEISVLFRSNFKNIKEILEEAKISSPIFMQRIATAKNFDAITQTYFDGLQNSFKPVLILPFFEASIVKKLETKIFLVEQKKSMEKLIEILKNFVIETQEKKVALILNQNKAKIVFQALQLANLTYCKN